jgi:hypothetical protein
MRFEKKHKIYAGLVGAALVAWGIDAVFFESASSPGPAAGAAVATQESTSGAPLPQTAHLAQGRDDRWLSDRLRAWSAEHPSDPAAVRDIFAPSSSWAAWSRQTAAPATAPAGTAASEFKRAHHLSAVVITPSGRASAVIDGQLLRVGQSVGGCRLVAVGSGSADLITPDGEQFRIISGTDEAPHVR